MASPDHSPLYDILREAFEAGRAYETDQDGPVAARYIAPLAARMEEAVKKLIEADRDDALSELRDFRIFSSRLDNPLEAIDACMSLTQARSLPSSPERETL